MWYVPTPTGGTPVQVVGPTIMHDASLIGSPVTSTLRYVYINDADSSKIYILPIGSTTPVALSTLLPSNVKHLTSDGASTIWYQDASNTTWKATVNSTGTGITGTIEAIDEVYYLGNFWSSGAQQHLAVIHTDRQIHGHPASVDYVFDFPNNAIMEIMMYQLAVDFRRKQNVDYSLLKERLDELQVRLMDSFVRRDEDEYETIGNVYSGWTSGANR